MKAPFSPYLEGLCSRIRELVDILGADYDYVSALSTDSRGFALRISQRNKTVSNETMTTERGTVIRAGKDGLYSEYAFDDPGSASAAELAERIRKALDDQLSLIKETGTEVYETGVLDDEPIELFVEKETELLPEEMDLKELVESFTAISDRGVSAYPEVVECFTAGQSTHISKMFITRNRLMKQSYVYSEGSVAVMAAREGDNKIAYEGVSGLCGPEAFREMPELADKVAKTAVEMLDAERVAPGLYDVIVTPDVAGLIAHEAFGHGVEMDMFVKKRALGEQHIGKRVGSDLVTMHEGANCAVNVTSYAFDDEGTPASDVIEIDKGILKTGICDALAAKRLGTVPTGNGKRQNFAHKVYTRMTNTVFDSGNDKLEDMIASIEHGYLLDGVESGMEDPKHWGIQCIVSRGYEIAGGKLTGKMISPVVMTGYVPDLLGSISMASGDRKVSGNGGCGKGHKEWVKVADGGPYLKAKARLG